MNSDKPLIAITMGDPSGVGPEIAAKALSNPAIHEVCTPFVIGDLGVLEKAMELSGVECTCQFNCIKEVDSLEPATGTVQVLDLGNVDLKSHRWGAVGADFGKAAGQYIQKAVELAKAGKVHAVATAPIQKESFKAAGYPYPGHTEMFGELTGAKNYALMLMTGNFRVVHVSLHTSLRKAVDQVTRRKVLETIEVAHRGCQDLGIDRPRIAVAGLNPHAGEGGLFGDEEKREIVPAIEDARRNEINVEGPFSSDTVFSMLKGGKFDIVVCMYHDQGGIPMKLLSFEWDAANHRWGAIRGVNVTLGLPIIRTSVSHGTGFEVAGKGVADSTSLEEAIVTAAHMARIKFPALRV